MMGVFVTRGGGVTGVGVVSGGVDTCGNYVGGEGVRVMVLIMMVVLVVVCKEGGRTLC